MKKLATLAAFAAIMATAGGLTMFGRMSDLVVALHTAGRTAVSVFIAGMLVPANAWAWWSAVETPPRWISAGEHGRTHARRHPG